MNKEPGHNLTREFNKLTSRNEELAKQDNTLRREYTTLFRKVSSLIATLRQMDDDLKSMETEDEPRLISENTLEVAPALDWYNSQISIIQKVPDSEEFELPKELLDSYKIYKNTPLLYKDAQESE
ncbi:similar to Saccharomyces cerevisiae YER092W IES5 Protein that associates with the INO80 chromatin remodeling complex under low-salt conditions [Maudiozyma saulgeensis]|uniref:Similar to Saccharomyces cerevisiae YER092W IES5 Protein that associates with the INO80 chromatin remodeling complex under low-salt conditions n=1 Tax=Maudiozyma saulgeensis TaxID=1789683 RepID=A0A1X7QYH9_9SACH|nr:similar to Saccharomyces cerevisiae YER092W IES5 Protein that associates with the INO80 chromatin remodeling complex under low-salt conditions [Kazachstania saulgeensis]